MSASDVRLVSARRLIASPVDAVFALAPGDRPLVSAGDSVVLGAPIAERLRDPRLDEMEIPAAAMAEPGGRWVGLPRRGDEQGPGGEYVFDWHGRWRVATGDMADAVESPFAGIVRSVRPGTGITIRAAGRGIRGVVALGGPTRGRLQAGAEGELRSGGLDVGSAGTILVVGSRVDAETLTRARAMGVCGVVVAGLSSKALVRLVLQADRVVGEERLLASRSERIRSVVQGPEGALYLLTDGSNGKLLKLTPERASDAR